MLRQDVLIAVFESGVISTQEYTADILQAILNLRSGAGEAAAGKLHFTLINL
jgi:hypothetical protein